jgi:hypothetical protein
VKPRDAVRALAFGRIVIGVALLLAPRRVGRLMLGPGADNAAASVAGRALGIRDTVLGFLTIHTLDRPQVAQRMVATCGVVDAIDFVAARAARDELPGFRAKLFQFVAGGSAIDHFVLSRLMTSADSLSEVAAQSPPQPASSPETVMPDGADVAKRAMGARTESKL